MSPHSPRLHRDRRQAGLRLQPRMAGPVPGGQDRGGGPRGPEPLPGRGTRRWPPGPASGSIWPAAGLGGGRARPHPLGGSGLRRADHGPGAGLRHLAATRQRARRLCCLPPGSCSTRSWRAPPSHYAKAREAVAGTGTPSLTTSPAPSRCSRKGGLQVTRASPGDRDVIEANRAAILEWCRSGKRVARRPGRAWPPRYAARRLFGMSWTMRGRSKTARRMTVTVGVVTPRGRRSSSLPEWIWTVSTLKRLPRHVACVMDGNGRWATKGAAAHRGPPGRGRSLAGRGERGGRAGPRVVHRVRLFDRELAPSPPGGPLPAERHRRRPAHP